MRFEVICSLLLKIFWIFWMFIYAFDLAKKTRNNKTERVKSWIALRPCVCGSRFSMSLLVYSLKRPINYCSTICTILCMILKKRLFSCEFCEVFRNIYFVEYLRTAVSELIRYKVYIFLSEVRLEEKVGYKSYLRIRPDYVNELFCKINCIYERSKHT